jgi:hypothetical protein
LSAAAAALPLLSVTPANAAPPPPQFGADAVRQLLQSMGELRQVANSQKAWEIWLQVQMYLQLKTFYSSWNNVYIVREVIYPGSQERCDLGLAATGPSGWRTFIEMKCESGGYGPGQFVQAAMLDIYRLSRLSTGKGVLRIAMALIASQNINQAYEKEIAARQYHGVQSYEIKQPSQDSLVLKIVSI